MHPAPALTLLRALMAMHAQIFTEMLKTRKITSTSFVCEIQACPQKVTHLLYLSSS